MVGGIFYEHGHRMVATVAGILTIILAVWLARSESRAWVRRLGWIALATVVFQGILGGITVKFFLPPAVSISHATLAQVFFCIVVSLAVFTSWWWQSGVENLPDVDARPLVTFTVTTVAALLVQLVLGAAYRHKVLGILPHALWAIVVAVIAFRTAGMARRERFDSVPALARVSSMLHIVLGVQLALGGAALWARLATREYPQPMPAMVWTTVAHVACGALVLGVAVVLMLCALRVARPSESSAVQSRAQGAAA
jgi:cytochrome c oxidase assembly protein subunit 15